jgi:DNA-binding CsgD family transcriptional regulator
MNNKLIAAALVVQTVSLALFCYQFLGTLIASPALKITWRIHEMIEITSIVGLVVGACMTLYALRASLKRTKRVEEQLAIASASFHQMMLAKFDDWALSDAEREVATMIIKGFSVAEIAEMRNTSQGTIKAQNTAIYQKSGVSGRVQLVSFFLEELTADL